LLPEDILAALEDHTTLTSLDIHGCHRMTPNLVCDPLLTTVSLVASTVNQSTACTEVPSACRKFNLIVYTSKCMFIPVNVQNTAETLLLASLLSC